MQRLKILNCFNVFPHTIKFIRPPYIIISSSYCYYVPYLYSRQLVFCKKFKSLKLYNCKVNLTVIRNIQFGKQIGLYRYKSKNSCAQLISILISKFIQKVDGEAIPSSEAQIGWTYKDGVFSPPIVDENTKQLSSTEMKETDIPVELIKEPQEKDNQV